MTGFKRQINKSIRQKRRRKHDKMKKIWIYIRIKLGGKVTITRKSFWIDPPRVI